jgi:hypothetical protein
LKINLFSTDWYQERIAMGSQNRRKKTVSETNSIGKLCHRVWIAFLMISTIVLGRGIAGADALEYLSPWSIGTEFMYSFIDGQMGFDQTSTGYGSLNNLKNDLGLPQDNQTFRVYATMRPLEHHMLRVFGNVPEYYQGEMRPQWDLRLTHLPSAFNANAAQTTNDRVIVFPAGTLVKSQMRTAQFGFGYDLDFVLGPGHAAGLQGELRYIDLRLSLSDRDAYSVPPGDQQTVPPTLPKTALTEIGYQTNIISIDELVPCLGAHAQAVLPFGFSHMFPELTLGGYTRMSFGLYPGYLNYVDIQAGLQLNSGSKCGSRRFLVAKFGLEHESIFHDGAARAGRVVELKRDGLTCALEAVF